MSFGVAIEGVKPFRALLILKIAVSHCWREYEPKFTDKSTLLEVCTARRLLVIRVEKDVDVSATV